MPVNIIAEIGSNWEGDIDLGKLHIKKAKDIWSNTCQIPNVESRGSL